MHERLMNMNLKKSALLLSLAAIPAITVMGEQASANTYYNYDSTQVSKVIQLIDNIDPTSATYSYYLQEAYTAYYNLNEYERYGVTNANTLFYYYNYTAPNGNYYQNVVQTFTTKMNAISMSKSTFLRDVQEANRYYDSLTVSEKSSIPTYLVTQLNTYNDNITKMRAVENSFKLLTTADPNYTTSYLAVLRDYNALPYSYRLLIQDIADEKAQQYTQYHSTDYNRSVAQKVVTAISNLTTSSKEAAVSNVRAMYNDLTTLQKQFVTNIRDLQYIEDVQKNIENGWDPYYYDESMYDNYDDDFPEISVNQRGSTYYINMPVSEMNTYTATTITVSDNISLKIPRLAVPVTNKSAVVAMTIEDNELFGITFSASLYNENFEFASYIDIEVKGLRASDVFMRVDDQGEYVAAPFARVLNKHVIKTKASAEYVVNNETPLFFDIRADGHRYEIEQLAKRKIVSGVETNYYKPSAHVTISQYAAMISRAMDLTAKNSSTYIDVQGKWFEDSIEALIEAGILEDKKSNYFNPGQVVTRKQAAQMSIRMLQHAGVSISDPDYAKIKFPDFYQMSPSERYYVALANEFGIFGGKADGRFDPNGQLTRSQMAKVLHRTLQIAKMM